MKTTLLVPLSASDTSITLESGELTAKAVLHLGNESVHVQTVLTPTQGRILRGMDGTVTSNHPAGTVVTIQEMAHSRSRAAQDANVGLDVVKVADFGEAWVKQQLAAQALEIGRLNDRVAALEKKVQQSSVDELKAAIFEALSSVK